MNDENKIAYIFTDKETGSQRAGLLFKSENGHDVFRVIEVEDISVPNPDGTGIVNETEKYRIEKVDGYKGPLPTWSI